VEHRVAPADTRKPVRQCLDLDPGTEACLRVVWTFTEKFVGTSSLYWDTLFGAHTADALTALSRDEDSPAIALVARCTVALAARPCLRELAHVAEWTWTKGPY